MQGTPFVLCILDGFGLNPNPLGNAVACARKPAFDQLWNTCPHATLVTYGERVGLPAGQMGNSEVGHQNIGAGRVIEQSLFRISKALNDSNSPYRKIVKDFVGDSSKRSTIHLIGLLSDGGVHSHIEHLALLIPMLIQDGAKQIALHLIMDGRDTGPQQGIRYLEQIEQFISDKPAVKIATMMGRFYAMDRDKRWERGLLAYRAIALGDAPKVDSLSATLSKAYAAGTGDEFIEPVVLNQTPIADGDQAIFWNFREDRMRQLVALLCSCATSPLPSDVMAQTPRKFLPQNVLCFTQYDATYSLPVLFEPISTEATLGEVLARYQVRQLRIAETEKYPHVTYFFNSGREEPFALEKRVLIPSPRDVKTYDLKPGMSAAAVCDGVIEALDKGNLDFIVVNFANSDMVGHTGSLSAAIEAVEVVDQCLGRIAEKVRLHHGTLLVLADHGNSEQMINYSDGTPHTAHTTYPVPLILLQTGESTKRCSELRQDGALCDIAPTVLQLLGIPQPPEMSGQALTE